MDSFKEISKKHQYNIIKSTNKVVSASNFINCLSSGQKITFQPELTFKNEQFTFSMIYFNNNNHYHYYDIFVGEVFFQLKKNLINEGININNSNRLAWGQNNHRKIVSQQNTNKNESKCKIYYKNVLFI